MCLGREVEDGLGCGVEDGLGRGVEDGLGRGIVDGLAGGGYLIDGSKSASGLILRLIYCKI